VKQSLKLLDLSFTLCLLLPCLLHTRISLSIVTISTLALLDFLDLDSTTCFFQLGTQLLDFCFDLGSCCIVSLPHCVKLFVFFSNRRSTLLTALLGLHSPTEVFQATGMLNSVGLQVCSVVHRCATLCWRAYHCIPFLAWYISSDRWIVKQSLKLLDLSFTLCLLLPCLLHTRISLSIVTISTLALLDFLDLDSTTCFFQLGTQLLDFCFDLGSCCIVCGSIFHCRKEPLWCVCFLLLVVTNWSMGISMCLRPRLPRLLIYCLLFLPWLALSACCYLQRWLHNIFQLLQAWSRTTCNFWRACHIHNCVWWSWQLW